jgi:alpha-L-fucosidase
VLHSKALRCILVCVALFGGAHSQVARAQRAAKADAAEAERERRLKWFREARFGLFIHWGLYAVPAGEWKGQLVPGIGEWIMNRARIPVTEYEPLTKQFNPVEFDADTWVRLARDAGMKYLVITSKHHDGFAMYQWKVSRYTIADATPFKRDHLKELAEACCKYGVRLGFYYSQTQDWPAERKRDFQRYLDEKVKPQTLRSDKKLGLTLVSVRLVPAGI